MEVSAYMISLSNADLACSASTGKGHQIGMIWKNGTFWGMRGGMADFLRRTKIMQKLAVPALVLTLFLLPPANAQITLGVLGNINKSNLEGRGSDDGHTQEALKQEEESPLKWGSLELNPHVNTSSLTPFGVNVGVFVLPYIEVEPSLRTGGSGSAFSGKVSGNYVGGHIGGIDVVPYASVGYGLAFINELDDDPLGFWTFGIGLKIFLNRAIAVRTELGHTNYEGSGGKDTMISFGLSFVPY